MRFFSGSAVADASRNYHTECSLSIAVVFGTVGFFGREYLYFNWYDVVGDLWVMDVVGN